ncbi:hypothetical protein HYU21_01450 [Candidatus Woesearchaeota archaeon]|nr:hypothetical protein [Candidatus Woesearchaeota archaeon]
MKKTNFKHKTYNSLSTREAELLNLIESLLLISLKQVQRLTGWNAFSIKNAFHSLKNKNILTHLERNSYILTEKIPENIFSLACVIRSPSYISFWTACSYYGYTEQLPKTIQLVSIKQFPSLKVGEYTLETTTFQSKNFFGYKKINNFAIAEKEKLLIEILYKPEKAGGLSEVKKCLNNMWAEINPVVLLEYLHRFNNRSCFARLGYLLEEIKITNKITKELEKNLPIGFVKLNSQKKASNKYNQKWRININDQ